MQKVKLFFGNIKSYIANNKTKSITILVVLILTIVSSITLIAYSFYQNKSRKLIISAIASLDSADVSIKVYRENKNDSGVGIGTYSLSYYVPSSASYSYVSSKTVCGAGITIEKYENQKFYVDATKKGKCKVYFDAIDGYIDDYEVNLFVQQEAGNTSDNNYNKMGQLPLYESGYYYTINTSKTSCTNGATVTIEGRNIVVLATKKSVCNVYADKNSDSVGPTVSNLSVDVNKVSFTASDNIGLAMYGLSTSNNIAPDDWYYFSGTSQTTTFEYATEGTYYLWVKDTAGNNAISEAITIILDASNPVVGDIDAYTKNAVIALSDDNNLAGYAVTTTSTTPTSWTTVSGKTASVTYPTTTNGIYYIHVKDGAGKTTSKSFSMVCAETTTRNFDYTGAVQNYATPCRGSYTLHVWGAQGGSYNSTHAGGNGGYATGTINLSEKINLYIYVGGQGTSTGTSTTGTVSGGFNGGGNGHSSSTSYLCSAGGGATDIRIAEDSLYSRVIVAGGGGGAGSYSSNTSRKYSGGVGGGTSGTAGGQYNTNYKGGLGGGQTAAGTSYYGTQTNSTNTTYGTVASFGTGASAGSSSGVAGGGGGWYGGGYGRRAAGGGGSGYVYTSSTASNYPTGCKLTSSHYLTNASTTAGSSSFTGTSGSSETGHSGNGYARIIFEP